MNKKTEGKTLAPFMRLLKERGLKATKGRDAIAKEALSRQGHFDIEELYRSLKAGGLNVSRASVYRTLPLLVESGLLEEVERTEKHAHYERTSGGHHDHMLCISCGSVIEFYSAELERLQNKLCTEESFEGVTHSLEIKGYCRKCRKSQASDRSKEARKQTNHL